jgi:hypothetical protein
VISPNAAWHPGHIRLEFHDAEGQQHIPELGGE